MIHATYGSLTHYQTLGVFPSATQEEIKHAYRRLAKKYHPDHNRKRDAEARFKEINEAYQVLGDPDRRQIYDYDLAQSRKAGAAPDSGGAGASAPPPPHSSGSSSRAGAQAPPPPPVPSVQGAYRYLFFFRGVLVGGAAAGGLLVLALVSYVACHRSSAEKVQTAPPPGRVEAVQKDKEPATGLVTPESTPNAPEPTPTHVPTSPTPAPTPVTPEPTLTPEPTPPAREPTPAPPPVQFSGEWRGSIEWFGTRVPFVMRLEQHGDEISGFSTETHSHRVWRSRIYGRVTGDTVTLEKRCERSEFTMTLVISDSSSELLRGTWEMPQNRGSWRASPGGRARQRAFGANEPWRLRVPASPRAGKP